MAYFRKSDRFNMESSLPVNSLLFYVKIFADTNVIFYFVKIQIINPVFPHKFPVGKQRVDGFVSEQAYISIHN